MPELTVAAFPVAGELKKKALVPVFVHVVVLLLVLQVNCA